MALVSSVSVCACACNGFGRDMAAGFLHYTPERIIALPTKRVNGWYTLIHLLTLAAPGNALGGGGLATVNVAGQGQRVK